MFATILRLSLALLLAVFFVSAAGAQVHDVDCVAGPNLTIQDGVNAAADGDIVVVHPCAATYPAFTVSSRNNLQIVSADLPSFNVSAFPVGVNAAPTMAGAQITDPGTCVRIEGSTNISVVGLVLENCGANGFEIDSSRRISLHGNESYDAFGGDGVVVLNSVDVDLVGNYIEGSVGFGISTDPSTVFVNIQANRILANDGGGVLMDGEGIDVVNNEVRNNGGDGISVRSIQSKVSRNWVVGNSPNQIDFANWPLAAENCVVGNWLGGAGLFPPLSVNGCQSDNF